MQADSDPGRDGLGSSLFPPSYLETSTGCVSVSACAYGRWGRGVSRDRLFAGGQLILGPIQLCGDLAGLLCPRGRAREGKWRVMIPAVRVLGADANAA